MNFACSKIESQSTITGKRKPFFQPKLAINQPNDIYEQQADAVAENVMQNNRKGNNPHSFFTSSISSIQRKCSHCEEEEKTVNRKEVGDEAMASSATEKYLDSLSGGRALGARERSFFEPAIGYDFSNVKLHTDSRANESAKNINALAYTHGNNIVFANNQYQPGTETGNKLLAHELTHVVQQSGNVSPKIQRQPEKEKEPSSDIAKAFKRNDLFKKLPDFAQEKILDEIDHAPETITKAVLDKIIDLAPIDSIYKEGLKKVGEGIIKKFTGSKPAPVSNCDAIPGFHEGKTRDFKGQCCSASTESAQVCCPKDRFAPKDEGGKCCRPGEVVDSQGKCFIPGPVDPSTICVAPGKKDSMGKCCMPPMEVIDGMCMNRPQQPDPVKTPFSLTFRVGVLDDYNIDESVINSRQQSNFNEIKKQIHSFMEACPASMMTVTGFADKPGTEEHNSSLGQRRADHVKFLLQLDLVKINFSGLGPVIFTRSEGESNPVDTKAGDKFSARNRRVEIEFHSMCPALGESSGTKPMPGITIGPGSGFRFNTGDF